MQFMAMKKLRKWSEDSAFTPFKMDKKFLTISMWKGYLSVKNGKGGKGSDLRVEPPLIKPGSEPRPQPFPRGAELENGSDTKCQEREYIKKLT